MTARVFLGTEARGLAAAAITLHQRTGTQLTDGGELLSDQIAFELER